MTFRPKSTDHDRLQRIWDATFAAAAAAGGVKDLVKFADDTLAHTMKSLVALEEEDRASLGGPGGMGLHVKERQSKSKNVYGDGAPRGRGPRRR